MKGRCYFCATGVEHPWHDSGEVNEADIERWQVGGDNAGPLHVGDADADAPFDYWTSEPDWFVFHFPVAVPETDGYRFHWCQGCDALREWKHHYCDKEAAIDEDDLGPW